MSPAHGRDELGFETVQFRKFPPADGSSLVEQLGAVSGAGFDWVCLNLRLLAEQHNRGTPIDRIEAACLEHSLPCRMLQSLTVSGDPADDTRRLRALGETVERFQPEVISCNFFVEPIAPALRWFESAIHFLTAVAPSVRFAIEFGPLWPVPDIEMARSVLREMENPAVGLLLDAWHFFHGSSSWSDLAAVPAVDIFAVQLNDHGALTGDLALEKDRRSLPGTGTFDLERLVAVLHDKGYDGLVSAEVISGELEHLTAVEFAARLYETSRAVWPAS